MIAALSRTAARAAAALRRRSAVARLLHCCDESPAPRPRNARARINIDAFAVVRLGGTQDKITKDDVIVAASSTSKSARN